MPNKYIKKLTYVYPDPSLGEKVCRKCKESKTLIEFGSDKGNKDGMSRYCKPCTRIRSKNQYHRYGEKLKNLEFGSTTVHYKRSWWLKHRYNMTIEDYNKLFAEQGGCCAICGVHQRELKKTISVDHDHATGKVRGLLCDLCNKGIGEFMDSTRIIESAIKYLEKHNTQKVTPDFMDN